MRIEIEPGTHLYGRPAPGGMAPVTVTVRGPDELRIEEPRYPPTRPLEVAGVAAPLHVFEGDVEVIVPIVFAKADARPGDLVPLDIEVHYQACTNTECFLPVTDRVHLEATAGRLNRRPRPPQG